jgi:hypothetical protein
MNTCPSIPLLMASGVVGEHADRRRMRIKIILSISY